MILQGKLPCRGPRKLLRLPLTRVRVPDQLSSDGPIVLRPHQTQFATLLFLTLSGFSYFPLFSLSPISICIHTFCFPSTVAIQLAPRSFSSGIDHFPWIITATRSLITIIPDRPYLILWPCVSPLLSRWQRPLLPSQFLQQADLALLSVSGPKVGTAEVLSLCLNRRH